MFENSRRGQQAGSFTTNVSKILDLKSSSEQIFFRKLSLGAPVKVPFSRFWEHHFQLPRFFALLKTSLPTARKVPFCAFRDIAWNRKKGSFFCALKHRLVKPEMDKERTILPSKYHSLERWKCLTSFSNKRYLFLTFIVNDKHRQKR